jgi:isochorismate synthase
MSQRPRPTLVPFPGGEQLTPPAQLRQLVAFALQAGLPVALWRIPGAAHAQLCLSFSLGEALTGLPPNLEPSAPAGFAFFPFRDSDHNPALFLPANVFFDTRHAGQFWVNKTGVADFRLAELREFLQASPDTTALRWHQSPQPAPATASLAEYTALVERGVTAIEQGAVQKVVSSRAARQLLPPGFDALAAFADLQAWYPQAFVSLVSAPGAGTWLGATPEVLAAHARPDAPESHLAAEGNRGAGAGGSLHRELLQAVAPARIRRNWPPHGGSR